jgi:monofunctional biosynthetic peptidoglycan transglycosylase
VLAVVMYRYVPVYVTPLMVIRAVEQKQADKPIKLKHKWLSLDKISHNMVQAVVASEDNLFMEHNGFDFDQIEKAIKEAKSGKRNRGASTISQQTAKNVFLWNGGGWFRKGLEAYFTVLIELLWSKERIMEIYLNSIEMGYGIYGVGAVAKEHFNKKAAKLTKREAALIAATLPNPLRYNSANPSAYMRKRQRQIVSLMDKIAPVEMGAK